MEIFFGNGDGSFGVEDRDPTKGEVSGTLSIYPKRKMIVVESSLTYTTEVRIVNLAGITVNTFTIEPGGVIEHRVVNAGVYIVQSSDQQFIKKLAVK